MASLWVKIEANMVDHPKMITISGEAKWSFVEMLLYCQAQLTNGFIDERVAHRKWSDNAINELTTNDATNPTLYKVDGGYQIHDYCEYQRSSEEVVRIKEAKRAAGAKGGVASGEARRSKSEAESKQNLSKTKPDTDTDTDNKELMFNAVERKDEYSDDFETWWKSYPRKQAKGDAWKAWKSVKKHLPDIETLVATSIAYEKTVTDPQFLKMPGPWLRARRWEDAALQPKQDTYNGYAPGVVTRGEAPEGRRYAADIIEDWNE